MLHLLARERVIMKCQHRCKNEDDMISIIEEEEHDEDGLYVKKRQTKREGETNLRDSSKHRSKEKVIG